MISYDNTVSFEVFPVLAIDSNVFKLELNINSFIAIDFHATKNLSQRQ